MYFFLLAATLLFGSGTAWAVEIQPGKIIIPDKAVGKIVLDGNLDDAIWQMPPLTEPFVSYIPIYNTPFPLETKVWAAYDGRNLYFAFRCFDPEPGKIKTSIVQRDKIQNDDQVGVLLDTQGTRQSSFEFYVNPNGIQTDGTNSAVSGPDITPDFVWYSAGKIMPDGYAVEMRIPLETIRFQPGKDRQVRMNVMFLRSVPHIGAIATWPAFEAGQNEFNFMAGIVYRELKSGLKLEILPNITYSSNSERTAPDTWETAKDTDIGVGIKYGITSSITAEATIYPDFSQVESDVFQMEVNRRYPLFFNEKRPFFMESKEVLGFTVIHQSMMINPLYTRFIADPAWALKLSGSTGKMNFAMLAADDRSAGRPWDIGVNPYEGKSALFGILRAKYSIGGDNTIGILYSGRHLADQQNDVVGADLKYRLAKALRASFSYLHSATREAEGDPLEQGGGLNAMLQYHSNKVVSWAIFERYDTDFSMATAFLNRGSISRAAFGIGPVFMLNSKALPWLKRVIPFTHYYNVYDLGTKMTDTSWELGINLIVAPMGEFYLEYWDENEAWAGQMLNKKYFHSIGGIQLSKWLNIFENITIGEQLYYHPTAPFVGDAKTINVVLTVEPSLKLKFIFDYLFADFKTKENKQEVYSGSIYNLHTSYQFNKYFFLRGIVRYDEFQEKLLTDVLASFTLIPGTVVHLGYGSLYLDRQWQNDMWMPGQEGLLKMKQGLFFKASYLWRF